MDSIYLHGIGRNKPRVFKRIIKLKGMGNASNRDYNKGKETL